MTATAFRIFKWTIYALLVLNTWLFLRTEDTLTAFLDSAAWVLLLCVMEYETRSLGQDYASPREKRIILAASLFAYAVIIYAWLGYIREEEWTDVVNASAWLGVCAVLVWQVYVPGEYEGAEYGIVNLLKTGLYALLVGCALWWTVDAENPLDAVDAWLWLACFAVIELNVFGFEHRADRPDAA
ncbi:hypothetical protein [Mangrovicoccus ximenensis]|uniref:hypothetical protein n=1 Tax=Mangrovicoccus ximenensis TaxID=1911570 RepID=UPI000D33D164|nr:hypothetical protein [Mangrovicoccus ximenensis]